MSRFNIKNSLIFFVSIIIFLIVFELFSISYYSNRPYKITFIDNSIDSKNKADIDFLIMGDSVCEGDIINDNSYGKKLEQALTGKSTSISCHLGYEMLDHYIRFNNIFTEYKPKNVILLVTMYNDFRKDFFMFNKNLIVVEPLKYSTTDSNIITSSKTYYYLLNNFKSAYFITSKIANIFNKRSESFKPYDCITGNCIIQNQVVGYKENIELLKKILKHSNKEGINFYLFTFPVPFNYSYQKENKDIMKGYLLIDEVCDEYDINCHHFIDLFSENDYNDMFTPEMLHANKELSEIMVHFTLSKIS
jgi:hypothetical protein